MPSQTPTATQPTADQLENRRLWERARIGSVILMVGIFVMFVGESLLRFGQRPGINIAQALNFAVIVTCVLLGRDPERRIVNCLLCLIGFSATAVAIGAVGILADNPTATLAVLVGLALGTAVLVPWGARFQLCGVSVALATAIWALAIMRPNSNEFLVQSAGSLLPTFGVSVIVAYLLRQQGLAVADAERERRARESGLRDANRRLEAEIRDHERTEETLRFALLELDHRVKNTLSTLQSIAEQTLETSVSPEDFTESFRGRIRAMARLHTALAARRWGGLGLRALVELAISPYRTRTGSIDVACDEASLSSDEARTLATALHELATNAAKYGALSNNQGKVSVTATVDTANDRQLRLVWSEQGGPQVREPSHRGLGTKLIDTALAYELGATVRLAFEPGGVHCEIDAPLGPLRDAKA